MLQQEISRDYWTEQMLNGNFEEAWKFSDEVLQKRRGISCWHLPRHQQYIWNGESLANKRVLIRCYHGLGDTLLFIRYAPLIKELGSQVFVWAQESLLPLLESVDGIDALIPLHDGSPEIDYDIDVEIMELPHIFRTTVDTVPSKIPYLHCEPVSLPYGNNLKVGLKWQVSDWEKDRSIPFKLLKPLFDLRGVTFFILENDAPAAGWQPGYGIYPGKLTLEQYARWIKSMDLVVTVDSMPAHLAGAMGVPVYLLLRRNVDWRWMRDRKESPWYPMMRLFRQEVEGEWEKVIEKVRESVSW
jgi:hypothetical protein